MKATELRIGNWLIDKRYTHDSENGRFKVHVRDLQYLTDIKESNECDFEPIPLTEEILLKCGFKKKRGDKFVLPRSFFNIWKIDNLTQNDYAFCYYCLQVNLKYLHQLQNLYWCLTGQELEINL